MGARSAKYCPTVGTAGAFELRLPGGTDRSPANGIAVPLRLRAGDDVLSFLSTVTTFGTAVDLTAAELSIEAFLPADAATGEFLRTHPGRG